MVIGIHQKVSCSQTCARPKYALHINFKFQNPFSSNRKESFPVTSKRTNTIHHTCKNPKDQIIGNFHVSKQNVIIPHIFYSKREKKVYQSIRRGPKGYSMQKIKNPLVCQLGQPVNGTSSNPITRINLQNSPKVFRPKSVLLHAFIQERTLYKDRNVCFIIFQHLHNTKQIKFYSSGE